MKVTIWNRTSITQVLSLHLAALMMNLTTPSANAASEAENARMKQCAELTTSFQELIIKPVVVDKKYATMGSLLRNMKDNSFAYCNLDVMENTSSNRKTNLGQAGSKDGKGAFFSDAASAEKTAKEKVWSSLCETFKKYVEFQPSQKLSSIKKTCVRKTTYKKIYINESEFENLAAEFRRYESEPQGKLAPFIKNIKYICSKTGHEDKNLCVRSGFPKKE